MSFRYSIKSDQSLHKVERLLHLKAREQQGVGGVSSDRGPEKSRSECHRIYSTNYHRPVSSQALVYRNWSLCRNTIVSVAPEEADFFPGRILAFVNMVTVSWSINASLLQISPLLSEEQWRASSKSLLSTAWHLKMYAGYASCPYSRGSVDTSQKKKYIYILIQTSHQNTDTVWCSLHFLFDYNVFSTLESRASTLYTILERTNVF